MRPSFAVAPALLFLMCPRALAEEPERRYLGTRDHLGVELGFGINSGDEADIFGVQPTLSGRLAATTQLGLEVDLPLTYVSVSFRDESENDFRLANPYVGIDYRLSGRPDKSLSLKLGIGLPVASIDEDSQDGLKAVFNFAAAWAARGLHRLWLYFPDNLTLVTQIRWAGFSDKLYSEANVALPFFIETSEQNDKVDFLLDANGRLGYDLGKVIPFIGLTAVIILSDEWIDEDDRFQSSLQLGALIDISDKVGLDLGLHLNLDDPLGFSLDEDGFLGLWAAVTIEL